MKLQIATVGHIRFFPVKNKFFYKVFFIKFKLNDLNQKFPFFSVNSFNLLSFYNKDHGDRDGGDLFLWAKRQLQKKNIEFNGEIFIHTLPRVLGFVFNPVSFWFCYESNELKAIIAEVNNTFSESHTYVLRSLHERHQKEFYVSPFYPVSGEYEFNFKNPNHIILNYFDQNKLQLATSIRGKCLEMNRKNILRLFFFIPLMTFKIVFLINFQAMLLVMKRVRIVKKPKKGVINER